MKKKIKLEMIKDAIDFVGKASKVKGDVWVSNECGLRADGKSILGIFSIAQGSELDVEYPDTEDEFDDFLIKLNLQAVGHLASEKF